jgi:hypothetical protein
VIDPGLVITNLTQVALALIGLTSVWLQLKMRKSMDGLLDARVESADAAGHARGGADEQARVATKLAAADASAERLEEIRGQNR